MIDKTSEKIQIVQRGTKSFAVCPLCGQLEPLDILSCFPNGNIKLDCTKCKNEIELDSKMV